MKALFGILNGTGEYTAKERVIGIATTAAVILVALLANI